MNPVTIIAEVGSSHNGSLERALELVDASASAGADIVKFQLFSGDDLWHTSRPKALESTRRLAVPPEWLPALLGRSLERNVEFMATPFSTTAVGLLEALGVKLYKVSSGDLTYYPLLEAIAQTGKPVFLSVGASDFKVSKKFGEPGTSQEIDAALSILKLNPVVLLHCIPDYPAKPKHANIRHIMDLAERYTMKDDREIPVGLSSHLREWWIDIMAIAYNVRTIEKHIDLEGRRGPEGAHSLDPLEFSLFVAAVRDAEGAMIKHTELTPPEKKARVEYRRNPKDWLRPNEER